MERMRKLRKAKPFVKLTCSTEVEEKGLRKKKYEWIIIVLCFLKGGEDSVSGSKDIIDCITDSNSSLIWASTH